MKRIYQVTSILFLGLGGFLTMQGTRLGLHGQVGPGPGFFAFWVGTLIVMLSLVWLVQTSLAPAAVLPADLLPPRNDLFRLAAVIASVIAFMALLRPLGFDLAMLGLLLVLLFVADRRYPLIKIATAFIASFGLHQVFEKLLKVPLPFASLQALRGLGF